MRPSRALLAGLLHGPAELLPISSSAHAALLLRDADPERRKELEVALHAGTLAALGLPRPAPWLVAATLPAALAGAALERVIERRLGTPATIAAGLVAGGAAMAIADLRRPAIRPAPPAGPPGRGGGPGRDRPPRLGQALTLGAAQAVALVPGVSRHGAALTALRALGFDRERAHAVSREASKPVLLGAALLKGLRVARRGEGAGTLAAAAAASYLSTRVALRLLPGRIERAPLWPFALYRAALAASVRAMPASAAPTAPADGAVALAGRVVAITGGARGIGRATAEELRRRGAAVAIGDIDGHEEAGAALGVPAHRVDVTDRASFAAFLDAVEAELGPLDVLVNNAGIAPLGRFAAEDDAVTRRILDVDLFGVALGSKLAIERMRPRGRGRIVNVASAAGRFATAGLVTYSAAKHGVLGLTDALRAELRGTGIETTVVLPGPAETDMIAGTRRSRWLRVVSPADVARAIADGLEAGRAEIWVPRVNGILDRLTAPLGGAVRRRLLRMMEADRMYVEVDTGRRERIEERMRAGA
jgi:hypothetical protein